MNRLFILFMTFFLSFNITLQLLFAEESKNSPLLSLGGGYLDTRKHAGALFQAEYKYKNYLWQHLKPQINFLLAKSLAGYIGFGVGWEFYLTKHIILIPSFSPGIYWKGRGRDLGYPLEFRSAFEIAYEMKYQLRLGFQISHVSNAHLSSRNPGFNAWMLCISIPLRS